MVRRSDIDPERLAALLDGTVDDATRRELVALVSHADAETRAAYADAAAVLAELEADDVRQAPAVVPAGIESIGTTLGDGARAGQQHTLARARARRRWTWYGAALAAGIAAVVLIPRADPDRASTAGDPGRFATALGTMPPAAAASPMGWSSVRGAGTPLSPAARAVRLGALVTDLELAARARDTTIRSIAAEAARLVGDLPASGPTAAVYREVGRRAGQPADSLARYLAEGRSGVAALAGAPGVELGAWLEAARLASEARRSVFFDSPAGRGPTGAVANAFVGDPRAQTSIDSIRLLARAPTRDWSALTRSAEAALRVLGGG